MAKSIPTPEAVPSNKWKEGTFTMDDMRTKYSNNLKSETWNRSTKFAVEYAERRVDTFLRKAMQTMSKDDVIMSSTELLDKELTDSLSEHNQEDSCDTEAESLDFSNWEELVDEENVMELVASKMIARGFKAVAEPGWLTIDNTWSQTSMIPSC